MTQEEPAEPDHHPRRPAARQRQRPQRRPAARPSAQPSRPISPPANPDAPSFLCDVMLGRLARELRQLGIDAEYDRNLGGMAAYRQARRTGRILLTRANKARDLPGVMCVLSQVAPEQVIQVRTAVEAGLKPVAPVVEPEPEPAPAAAPPLPPEGPAGQAESTEGAVAPAFEEKAAPPERARHAPPPPEREPEQPAFGRCLDDNTPLEKISREQARPLVPFFVYQIHHDFRRCPKCKKVYWPGNHVSDMERRATREPSRGRSGRPGRRRS